MDLDSWTIASSQFEQIPEDTIFENFLGQKSCLDLKSNVAFEKMDESISLIKQLDDNTVRKICSGQVIISMAAAVKELIENSIDANATYIVIKFSDFGKNHIEVVDNGIGIEESNFDLLGRRNCTSKLSNIDFLDLINTFGFRGEALNSLCNLADVQIHTRHSSQSIGSVLTFDNNGLVKTRQSKAREIGTTVTLLQLFKSLPVRRKELLMNLKRSFDKTLSLIYQYCLGRIGLKIHCLHQKSNCSNYSTLFVCNGISIQSNIIEVFDFKQFSMLKAFVLDENLESDTPLDVKNGSIQIKVDGFISKPDHGCGRSSSDRQYFYLNGRVCDLPMLSRQINKVYRTFNRNQYPFVLLRIEIDEKLIDRNLSPDKRTVILADNHQLVQTIQSSCEKMFRPENNDLLSLSQMNLSSFLKRSSVDEDETFSKKSIRLTDSYSMGNNCDENNKDDFEINLKNDTILSYSEVSDKIEPIEKSLLIFEKNETIERKNFIKPATLHPFLKDFYPNQSLNNEEKIITSSSNRTESIEKLSNNSFEIAESSIGKIRNEPETNRSENDSQCDHRHKTDNLDLKEEKNASIIIFDDDFDEAIMRTRKNETINIDIEAICSQFKLKMKKSHIIDEKSDENLDKNFSAKIKPEENEKALKELKHVLSKYSFDQMEIIGQFNLGFIIAKLQNHLFIIDQHAIDERFNFERFLEEPQLSYQNLVCPLNLRLSAINEMTVCDNLDLFEKFGFKIDYDSSERIGGRIKVHRIPIGKEWSAGKEDIEEMINALRDSPKCLIEQESIFPFTGLKREIASRACRSSVMIGESLSKSQMAKLLSQMKTVRDPWHCAHNRPTIRHLICTNDLD